MVVEYDLKKMDFVTANTLISFMNPVMFVMFLCFALFFSYMNAKAGFTVLDFEVAGKFCLSVASQLITMFFFVGVMNGLLSLFSPKMKKGVLGYHKIELNEDCLIESTEYNETKHNYKAISKVKIVLDYVFIMVSGTQGHAIRVGDFASRNEALEFIEYINSRI